MHTVSSYLICSSTKLVIVLLCFQSLCVCPLTSVPIPEIAPTYMQALLPGFLELHEVLMGPVLKPAKVPLVKCEKRAVSAFVSTQVRF